MTTKHFTLLGGSADDIDPDAKLSYYNEWVVGTDYTLARGLDVGVRYVHRDIGRVLEDVQPYPLVAISAWRAGRCDGELSADESRPGHARCPDSREHRQLRIAGPQLPGGRVHREQASGAQLVADLVVPMVAADRQFRGFFRNDNGQSDPGISSLYDYPTNDPTYTSIGGAQFGYVGDIRFLGTAGNGPLPLDRTHDVKLYGSYGSTWG